VHQDNRYCIIGSAGFKEIEPLARRRFLVGDIAEILEHWQAGRSIGSISRSFAVSRATIRKYVYAAEAKRGWDLPTGCQ
jgi:hypothetical protein